MFVDKETEAAFKKDEIVAFKLITGEEIIGKVNAVTREEILVDSPCTLVMTQQGLSLTAASMMCAQDKPVSYMRVHIVARMKPHDELVSAYRSATGGLEVPPQGLVIPKK